MPLPNQPLVPFTPAGIQNLFDGHCGCYGIYSNGVCLYIGRSQNLRARLLEHLRDIRFALFGATHCVTILNDSPELLEQLLIIELKPTLNQKIG